MARVKKLLNFEGLQGPETIANTIIMRSFKERVDISYLKLSSLVYLLYKDYLQRTGYSLFNERFEVSLFGPVIPTLEFKFGCWDIVGGLGSDAQGNTYAIGSENKDFELSLDCVWAEYGKATGLQLASAICQGTAFNNAKSNGEQFISLEDIKAEEHTYFNRI